MTSGGGVNLAVWSGPRNISTALMRSWSMRPDCRVVDEPLYAHYLVVTGADHPGRAESIAAGETSWETVVSELVAPTEGVYYQKHMAHHLVPPVSRGWIDALTNVVLIRHPAEMVASYLRSRATVEEADLGFTQLVELSRELAVPPPIVDADDFLRAPEAHLRWLCDLIDVEFSEAMLHWPAGRGESDGVWGRYWYESLWASTGFEPYRRREMALDEHSRALVERIRPLYEELHARRVVLGEPHRQVDAEE